MNDRFVFQFRKSIQAQPDAKIMIMRSANYKIVNTKNLDIIKLKPFSSLQHLALISKVSLSQHSSYQQKRTLVCFVKLSAEINCILETCHSDEITSRKH